MTDSWWLFFSTSVGFQNHSLHFTPGVKDIFIYLEVGVEFNKNYRSLN
jgi:hypothetical protein